jgi:hypothetical protein
MHQAQCLITTQCSGWLDGFVEHVEVRIEIRGPFPPDPATARVSKRKSPRFQGIAGGHPRAPNQWSR